MTEPLALVFYERLLPGSQLVNRLQDLGYRVQTVTKITALGQTAVAAGALVVFADLQTTEDDPATALTQLKQADTTKHLPVIAFADDRHAERLAAVRLVGITAVEDALLLAHLGQLLEQALQLD